MRVELPALLQLVSVHWSTLISRFADVEPNLIMKSTNDVVMDILVKRGTSGATLSEIYSGVRARLGKRVPNTSIRGAIYRRMPGAKSHYTPRYERMISTGGEVRYRLMTIESIGT
jgi:hypothetical protein